MPKVTQKHLLADMATKKIVEWLTSGSIPTWAEIRQLDPKTQTLAGLLPSLKLNKDGILYYHRENNKETKNLLVLPSPLDQAFIVEAHRLLAHKKAQAVCKFMETRVYFPNMLQITQETLRNCTPCAVKAKPFSTGHRTKLISPQDGSPFQKLSMDVVGPLPTAPGGFQYLVTVRCVFTHWMEAFPTRDTTSETLLKLLHSQIFSRFGLCENLHTDNGPQFVSNTFKDALKQLGIVHSTTSPYNPKSNQVERSHRDLEDSLTALCGTKPGTWVRHLPSVLFAMRVAQCRATGYSPFYLMFGRHPRCALDLLHPLPSDDLTTPLEHATSLRESLQRAFAQAREQNTLMVERARASFHRPGPKYNLGDLVWAFHPKPVKGSSRKLAVYWSGPWIIEKQVNDLTFKISGKWKDGRNREEVVTVERLRPYTGDTPVDPNGRTLDPIPGDPFAESCWWVEKSQSDLKIPLEPASGAGCTVDCNDHPGYSSSGFSPTSSQLYISPPSSHHQVESHWKDESGSDELTVDPACQDDHDQEAHPVADSTGNEQLHGSSTSLASGSSRDLMTPNPSVASGISSSSFPSTPLAMPRVMKRLELLDVPFNTNSDDTSARALRAAARASTD